MTLTTLFYYGFHTYYVGEAGAWVHNANCNEVVGDKNTAIERNINSQLASEKLPCFAAGTLVHTKEGLKPIEEIRVGDWVLSYPDDQEPPLRIREEHEYTYQQVTQTFVHKDKPVCEVLAFDIYDFKDVLKVTPDHPFYVRKEAWLLGIKDLGRKGWTPASELGFPCVVLASNNGHLSIGEVTLNGERSTVYNFEVDEFHTYYVGKLGVWVHNACGLETSGP